MGNKITVNWMFPDLLSLYGDRGNIMAIEHLGRHLGLTVELNRVEDLTAPTPADFVIFNSGDLDVISALADKKHELLEFIKYGKKVIVFGTTIALFGTKTTRIEHPGFEGLNLIESEIIEREHDLANFIFPAGDDYLLEFEKGIDFNQASGVYVKSVKVNLGQDIVPFAKVLYGQDNTGQMEHSGFDGAVKDNIIWTNLLGPAFVKNPWILLPLLEEVTGIKYPIDDEMKKFWEYEICSFQVFLQFINKKIAENKK